MSNITSWKLNKTVLNAMDSIDFLMGANTQCFSLYGASFKLCVIAAALLFYVIDASGTCLLLYLDNRKTST
jgi:hypothetical protein